MKKIASIFLCLVIAATMLTGCSNAEIDVTSADSETGTAAENICDQFADKVVERTPEKWAQDFEIEKYEPNNEITGDYDKDLAATCENGIFVGQKKDNVIEWKGIPYSVQPVGERRFYPACDPEPSDKVYEAYHYGHSCMQPFDATERASSYEMGEDCLNLNVWTNTDNDSDKKPVLVFMHGGGFTYGGTSDPLYDGFNFSYYNPEVIMVTITYRVGLMGNFNVSGFPDADKYETAVNNGVLDAVQALKWIKKNISAFGGDPDNVTLTGESAGAINISYMCTMPEAQGLVTRYVPMSGAVSQSTDVESSLKTGEALKKEFGVETVEDVSKIPFEDLKKFWETNVGELQTYIVRDGNILPEDPYAEWENGASKDVDIMHARNGNEFRYYQEVFGNSAKLYDAICESMHVYTLENSGDAYKEDIQIYYDTLKKLGYEGDDLYREYANDKYFNSSTAYQAYLHAKNGGEGYFYIFNAEYDHPEDIGSGHAIDCFYFFGNFDGDHALGTVDQQKLSRVFQKAIVSYAIDGDPSIEGLEWPEFNNDTRMTMVFDVNDVRVEENPEKERTDIIIKMCQDEPEYRYNQPLAAYFPYIIENKPEALVDITDGTGLEAKEAENLLSYNWETTNKRYKNFTDLGHYMLLADELKECDLDEIIATVQAYSGESPSACTCCGKIADNGDMLVGRNMDIEARQFPTILTLTSFGKYRTMNISYMFNGPWKYSDILEAGELDEYYARAVPFAATDVFNEEGLYIETNMRTPSDDFPFISTNPGKKRAPWTIVPALACSCCATVDEALEYIQDSYDYYVYNNEDSGMMGWNYAFFMADATGKYGVLECYNGELHFTTYCYGQANYYVNPTASAKELYGGGYGRLEFINKRLFDQQTKEDMLDLMSNIFFSKEVLYPEYSYRDADGKIRFVDDKGNEICDWRSDYSYNIFIYDDGTAHGFSSAQEGEEAYVEARRAGDEEGMKKNQAAHDKYEEERNRATAAWTVTDENFEALQKAVAEKNADNIDDVKEYYNGNEDPLRDNGHVWTSSISLGINCTDRSFVLKMWEKDDVQITMKW